MNDLQNADYRSPFLWSNGHLDTIVPHFLRMVKPVDYRRERIETDDGDFLDLDWSTGTAGKKLVIFSHGLEGSSRAKYIQGMVHRFRENGFDALAWNCRSCGGEINRTEIFYHSGASYDLDAVVKHVLRTTHYTSIHLIGFSMGGNITLKYLGERGRNIDSRIGANVVFSVPCDLKSSAMQLSGRIGRLYVRNFIKTLSKKFHLKKLQLEKRGLDLSGSEKIRDFKTWDDRFTAPLHGFKNAEDYWTKSSSRYYLNAIQVPTLIVNARNDPFLGENCFPVAECKDHRYIKLETPNFGGHVGFSTTIGSNGMFWSEQKALQAVSRDSNGAGF